MSSEQRKQEAGSEPEGSVKKASQKWWVSRLLKKWVGDEERAEFDWHTDAHQAYLEQEPLRAQGILYVIAAVFVGLVIWSAIAEIDEVARGNGKVIPSRQVQVIQSQDGGVVTNILVREGDVVNRGELLVSLDQTRSQSKVRENRAELQALSVKVARLTALVEAEDFIPLEEWISEVPRIVAQEQALFESGRGELKLERKIAEQRLRQAREELIEVKANLRQLTRSLELAKQEMELTSPMVASGAVSTVEILRLEREVNTLEGERDQARARMQRLQSAVEEAQGNLDSVEVDFVREVREKMADTLTRINSLRETGTGLSDRVKQTEVRSQVHGTVKQLHFYTIGGVVLPGDAIIDIVPLDDSLLVEARINPRDIAFLVPGQETLVKFSAYDFVTYGGLAGVVEHIGADTVMDLQGNPFYNVRVRTGEASLGDNMPILPGMTAEVDILTGKKSILSYLMKPVLRAKQVAMTER